MSGSVPPTQQPPPPPGSQSQASVLGPGIAGLFIQGIESGLVFDQFSQWFFRAERIESSVLTTIVVFVTALGLYASSRLLTARPHYLSCPVRGVRNLGSTSHLDGIITFSNSGWSCVVLLSFYCISGSVTPLTPALCLSCSQTGRITSSQLLCVESHSNLIYPNPVCRHRSCQFPFKL
jgi:hypothetical protein